MAEASRYDDKPWLSYYNKNVLAREKPEYERRVTEDDVRAYCKQRLAPYKVHAVIELRKKLPTTLTGKVFKRALREEEKAK